MIVIGLSAKLGCGKTTLAKYIMDLAPVEVAVRLAFGDQVKRETAEYFDFPVEWCYSQEGKVREIDNIDCTKPFPPLSLDRGPSVRELLQWYGTDYRRAQDPAYWTKAMQKQLALYQERHAHESLLVVVDDVRFPDEAQVCLDNGYCFRIEPFEGWQPGPHAGHASETALDEYQNFTEVYKPGYGLAELQLVAEKIIWRVFGQYAKEIQG